MAHKIRGHLITVVKMLLALTLAGFTYCVMAGHIKTPLTQQNTPKNLNKIQQTTTETLSAEEIIQDDGDSNTLLSKRWPIQCSAHYSEDPRQKQFQGCTPVPGGTCDRLVVDQFLTDEEVQRLIHMADIGMATGQAEAGAGAGAGPTIMDVNSGWVLPSGSHQPTSIYSNGQIFTKADYTLYKNVISKLKARVEKTYDLNKKTLYFTAPTFITREIGDPKWTPKTMHDEYWHRTFPSFFFLPFLFLV